MTVYYCIQPYYNVNAILLKQLVRLTLVLILNESMLMLLVYLLYSAIKEASTQSLISFSSIYSVFLCIFFLLEYLLAAFHNIDKIPY